MLYIVYSLRRSCEHQASLFLYIHCTNWIRYHLHPNAAKQMKTFKRHTSEQLAVYKKSFPTALSPFTLIQDGNKHSSFCLRLQNKLSYCNAHLLTTVFNHVICTCPHYSQATTAEPHSKHTYICYIV